MSSCLRTQCSTDYISQWQYLRRGVCCCAVQRNSCRVYFLDERAQLPSYRIGSAFDVLEAGEVDDVMACSFTSVRGFGAARCAPIGFAPECKHERSATDRGVSQSTFRTSRVPSSDLFGPPRRQFVPPGRPGTHATVGRKALWLVQLFAFSPVQCSRIEMLRQHVPLAKTVRRRYIPRE